MAFGSPVCYMGPFKGICDKRHRRSKIAENVATILFQNTDSRQKPDGKKRQYAPPTIHFYFRVTSFHFVISTVTWPWQNQLKWLIFYLKERRTKLNTFSQHLNYIAKMLQPDNSIAVKLKTIATFVSSKIDDKSTSRLEKERQSDIRIPLEGLLHATKNLDFVSPVSVILWAFPEQTVSMISIIYHRWMWCSACIQCLWHLTLILAFENPVCYMPWILYLLCLLPQCFLT